MYSHLGALTLVEARPAVNAQSPIGARARGVEGQTQGWVERRSEHVPALTAWVAAPVPAGADSGMSEHDTRHRPRDQQQ
jgi:hypothetical protein